MTLYRFIIYCKLIRDMVVLLIHRIASFLEVSFWCLEAILATQVLTFLVHSLCRQILQS